MSFNRIMQIRGLDTSILSYCDPASAAQFSATSKKHQQVADRLNKTNEIVSKKLETLEKLHASLENKLNEPLSNDHIVTIKKVLKGIVVVVTIVALATMITFMPLKAAAIMAICTFPFMIGFLSLLPGIYLSNKYFDWKRVKMRSEAQELQERILRMTENLLIHFVVPYGLSGRDLSAKNNEYYSILKESKKYLSATYLGPDVVRMGVFFRWQNLALGDGGPGSL